MAVFSGPEIVNDGLVLHLDAANPLSYPGTGTNWFDLSGNGNNGTLINGVYFNSENKGSMGFDGINDRVQNNSDIFNIGTGGFSIETFAYLESSASIYAGIFSSSAVTGLNGIHLTQRTCWIGTGSVQQGIGSNSIDSFPTNSWFHAVFMRSDDGTTLDLYVNTEKRFNSSVSSPKDVSVTDACWGQRYTDNASFNWKGSIAFGKFYNRALTESEIKQNFEATRDRYGI